VIRRIAASLLLLAALRAPGLDAQAASPTPAAVSATQSAPTAPVTQPAPTPPAPRAARVARGNGGAVAAAEENAARAGIEILREGGNAADAAVAVSFALAVTWPEAGNIGGGGFWNSRDARGRTLVVDYREAAPRLAARDLFTRPGRSGVAPSSTEGALASGVPGTVAGLALAHRRTGRLPWKTVLEPAVRLAREGFVMSEAVSESIAGEKDRLAKDPEAARIFLPGGAPPMAGKVFQQPDLARTLAAIRDRGEDGFYRGETARRFEESQRRAGGLISRGDLARYEAKVRKPLRFQFAGHEIVTTPAPSSGPVLAEMALAVARVADRVREASPTAVHWVAEIEKRAFRDRNRWLGDPAFPGVRERLFTDPARIDRLVASIDPRRATATATLARVFPERPTTTHFSVMDGDGMAVSITTTLNDSFGSARVAPGLGFLLNNEMDDFATRPGEKNMYGLVQGDVNAVAPGKRMLSSMCPSIAVSGGRNVLVWGTPGGSTIPTTNLQVLVRRLLRNEPLGDALSGARFHQQDLPDEIEVETGRFDAEWLDALRAMGHEIKDRKRLGCVHAIAVEKDGTVVAAADPRGSGAALIEREAR
jgi:gamma-glutamyltranspeptidase/glutathione hydrolase